MPLKNDFAQYAWRVISKILCARTLVSWPSNFFCSNWPTFPQIFIKGEFIGGSDIIMNMHQVSDLK
jgi:glutaredoxin-related protein